MQKTHHIISMYCFAKFLMKWANYDMYITLYNQNKIKAYTCH